MRTFKETSKIVEEVANIALQAAEEKGLTFREVLYLPEMIDAVNCDVPHRFIRETMTGKKETAPKEPGTVVTVTFDTEEFEKGLQGVINQIEEKFGQTEDEAEQEQEAPEKEPPEVTAESILAAAEETTRTAAEETTCRG